MRREWWVIAAVAALLGPGLPARSYGLCASSAFDENVKEAGLIFAGTVIRATPERVSGTIVTRYLFTDLIYAKGSGPKDSLVLTSEGGSVGGEEIWSEEAKHFERWKRYVTLATAWDRDPRRGYAPMMCVVGPFIVESDSASGMLVMRGSGAWPIAPPPDQYYGVAQGVAWCQRVAGSLATEFQFLDQIRAIVREQAAAKPPGDQRPATKAPADGAK